MSSLGAMDNSTAYLPASFFTRLYDMDTQIHNLQPILHEIHGSGLLDHENIFVPVVLPGHWASLWIDTTKRAIRYLDSYFQGGTTYANAMKAYLEDFERTLGREPQQPWTCISTTHSRSPEDATHIYVPRQLGVDDCGVYACIFAYLISQRRQISDMEQGWIGRAR